jgi:diguanylate cyclase (GGDEF)-like protein/PAS domain S-box-containing protein
MTQTSLPTTNRDDVAAHLLERLARAVGASHACFVMRDGRRRHRARVVACHPNVVNLKEIDLRGSACGAVTSTSVFSLTSGARKAYPTDTLLKRLDAEGFVCGAVLDAEGNPQGWIGLATTQPLENRELAEEMTAVVAECVAAELREREVPVARPTGAIKALPSLLEHSLSPAALEVANDGYWEWNLEHSILCLSARWCEMVGLPAQERVDTPESWFTRAHADDRPRLEEQMRRLVTGEQWRAICEHRVLHADGTYRDMVARARVIRDERSVPVSVIGWLSDVSTSVATDAQPDHDIDQLTGLPGREYLLERLRAAIAANKAAPENEFALISLDVDRFHRINARFGDAGGDDMLILIADALREAIRQDDVLARVGGDKFAVLLTGTDLDVASKVMGNRLLNAVRGTRKLGNTEVFVSSTIGVVIGHDGYDRPGEVLRDADSAIDEGKHEGGDLIVVFEASMHHAAAKLLDHERDVRLALERGQFVLYFQPMLRSESGDLCALEALLRWEHPVEGVLGPAKFLDVLRETGLITVVGRRVLMEACLYAADWTTRYGHDIAVSVNVAPAQLLHPTFRADVQEALATSGLRPSALIIEITEDAVIGDPLLARGVLQQLREDGIQVLVDDFGTGYSSLSYLRELPLSGVKIDRSFLLGVEEPGTQREILSSIVRLAHLLKLEVIAEGVETIPQLKVVRSLGCDVAQGYLLDMPLAPAQVEAFLSDRYPRNEAA